MNCSEYNVAILVLLISQTVVYNCVPVAGQFLSIVIIIIIIIIMLYTL